MATACCTSSRTSARSRSHLSCSFGLAFKILKYCKRLKHLSPLPAAQPCTHRAELALLNTPESVQLQVRPSRLEKGGRHFTEHIPYATTTTSRVQRTGQDENSAIARYRTRNWNTLCWRSEHLLFQMSEDGLQLNPPKTSPHFCSVNSKSIIPLVAAP